MTQATWSRRAWSAMGYGRCWADLKHSHALNQAQFRRSSGAINDKGPAIARQALEGVGRPCRDRTYDQRIKSPLLYQLS